MTNMVCGIAQGIGVTPYENMPENVNIFTETAIAETVKIPCVKPDMEQLLSVAVDAEIISTRLIKTAEGTSVEGQILAGYKLIIELKLRQKIKYIADEPTQSVHAAHFEKVVSSIFVVIDEATAKLFKQGKVVVTPYIEDIYAVMRDKKTVFKNIVVLVNVTTL